MIYISSASDVKEYALSLDSFLNPTVYKGKDALEILLIRLILLEPGTFETHPNMGIGLVSRYRYAPQSALTQLDREIEEQAKAYIPNIMGISAQTSIGSSGNLRIVIKANDEIFALTYDPNNQSNTLVSERVTLETL